MAIAVVALLNSEVTHLARTTVHRMHLADDLADLSAIGTDILHGSSTDFAWDEGEVLDAVELSFGHLGNKVVPLDARADEEVDRIGRLSAALNALDHRV